MNHLLASTVRSTKGLRSWLGGDLIGLWSATRSRGGELSWVLGGKLALMGANAALMLLLAHLMDLKLYGLMVTAISGQLLLSRLLLLGVDFGMIRLRSEELNGHEGIVRAGLMVISGTTSVLAMVLLALSLISLWLPLPLGPPWFVGSIFAGAVGSALVDYVYCYRLSGLQYRAAGLVQSGTSLARFVLTGSSAFLFPDQPHLVFLAYPTAALLIGLTLTAATWRANQLKPAFKLVMRLLRFSLWLGAANVTIILSLYQGIFLLILLRQEAQTGIFGLSLTLSLGFFAVYNAFGEYVLPQMARLENSKELQRFVKRALPGALAVASACVPVVILMGVILPKFLRPELREMSTFYFLAASMLLLIIQAPLEGAFMYLLRPHLVVVGWLLRVVFTFLLGFLLASEKGALGAAIAQTGAALIHLGACAAFAVIQLQISRSQNVTPVN
jgi:O-antigen/teichoic acid export membrane protein